jgi:tagatose-1,6-bisphosphate aldolase non-catalytic subunit AgaZ/GatZ
MKKLNEIQQTLKAPKNQVNKFGNYKYRSCEDILEAVKPLLGEAVLTINDEIVLIGDRYYVKATATIKEGEEKASVSAYAREGLMKKGMDESQITGSSSSYARKYALNGLFLIDDTKDADTKDNTEKSEPKQVNDISSL